MTPDNLEPSDMDIQEELKHRERQIQAMRRITGALFSHSTVDDMVRETLRVAIEVVQADVGSVQLHDADNDTLVFRYVIDPKAQNLVGYAYPTSKGIGGRVFRTGAADLTNKVSDKAEFNHSVDDMTGYHTESIMTAPLKHFEGKPIGIVQVLNARRPYDERDLEVLEVLTAQAAAAIEMAHLIEQARKAELINIIGDISHDIKNMLTPIHSGILTLQPLLDDLFEGLETIRQECPATETWGGRMAETMADLQDHHGWILEGALDSIEKLQSRTKEIADAVKGEMSPPKFEEADLHMTTEAVLRSLRPVAEQKQIYLKSDYDPQLPLAEFDRNQMYNALYNLVSNAIPETPPGGSITVRTRILQDETNMLLIEVEDTGRGIPESIRALLFTDATPTTKPGGTGMGTRIVRDVIRRHHGQITVTSQEGHGSKFTIRLPLSQAKR